jgi:putative ABC transport system permease protein
MPTLSGMSHRLRTLFARRAADAETLEELADHLERQTRKHVAAGMTDVEAARLARIELGGVQRWRDETAEARTGWRLTGFIGDCKYALRSLRRRPGFAAIAVLTLGLGLGASGAIFAVIDGALLRPLPFPEPARLVAISLRMPMPASHEMIDMVWSYPKFLMFRDKQTAFSALALYSPETMTIDDADGAERVLAEAVGSAYFGLLGARPALGRGFLPAEDSIGGGESVVVVSDAFWRTRLGADPKPIGRSIEVGGTKRTIVGVMPATVRGLSGTAQLWLPISAARRPAVLAMSGAHNISMIGRIASGVTLGAAENTVATLGKRIDETFPSDDGHWGAGIRTLNSVRVAPPVRRALELLMAAVALVVAMVCVNLLTLFFTRGLARREELAVRLAIGASRTRVIQQVVTETLIVTAFGAALGLVVGASTSGVLMSVLSTSMPSAGTQTELTRLSFSAVGFDVRAALFVGVGAVIIGAVIGLATALRSAPRRLVDALRQTASAAAVAKGRGALVVGQISLALVLLVVSGLTIDSVQRALHVPLGYQPDQLFSVRLTLDPRRPATTSPLTTWAEITREVASLPGVTITAFSSCSPIGEHCDGTSITPAGHAEAMHVRYHEVSANYFSTLKTPILRGREFDATDAVGTEPVMVINRAAARRIWGSDDPLTTPVVYGDRTRRVVGIVEDARYEDVERAPEPAIFLPAAQTRLGRGVLFVRTTSSAGVTGIDIKSAVRRAGRGHAMGDVRELTQRLRDAGARNRMSAAIVTIFAATALFLAGLGVYGSLALAVTQRSREFAIRRALGANRGSLVGMVAAQAARLSVLGGAIGLALAWAASREISGLLYDARALEPRVYIASALLLVMAVATAAVLPSIRTMRADPRDAMRAD